MRIPFFFKFYRSAVNYHGTQKNGEPSNGETVRGPKLKFLKLTRYSPGISRRLIFYFPSGKWWSVDFFTKLKVVVE